MRLEYILLGMNLWFLHGMDMTFYVTQDARLFDVNLFLSVMTTLAMLLLLGVKNEKIHRPGSPRRHPAYAS